MKLMKKLLLYLLALPLAKNPFRTDVVGPFKPFLKTELTNMKKTVTASLQCGICSELLLTTRNFEPHAIDTTCK